MYSTNHRKIDVFAVRIEKEGINSHNSILRAGDKWIEKKGNGRQ
jgi:hypothetical protein